jgi:hypothetical protein
MQGWIYPEKGTGRFCSGSLATELLAFCFRLEGNRVKRGFVPLKTDADVTGLSWKMRDGEFDRRSVVRKEVG